MEQPASSVSSVLLPTALCQGLKSREAGVLARKCHTMSFEPNQILWTEGSPAEHFIFITSGIVQSRQRTSMGKDVVAELVGPGDCTGLLSTLGEIPHPFTASTLVATEAIRIPADIWRDLVKSRPTLLMQTFSEVVPRMLGGFRFMGLMASGQVEQRLAAVLLRLVDLNNRNAGPVLTFPLTRKSLAEIAGTTTETAIRLTSNWQKNGWISAKHGLMTVHETSPLQKLLGQGF